MRNGLMVVLVLSAVVAGIVYVPKLLGGSDGPARVVEQKEPENELSLSCVHCRAVFAANDAKPHPETPAMLLCPQCGKPTPRRPAQTMP